MGTTTLYSAASSTGNASEMTLCSGLLALTGAGNVLLEGLNEATIAAGAARPREWPVYSECTVTDDP